MSKPYRQPPAFPHGQFEEVLPDIFVVRGSVKFKRPPMQFSRNMTVVRHDGELTIFNTTRLDDAGMAALDALGTVKHLVRVAGFHGMDDPFYKERYPDATLYAVEGMLWVRGTSFEGKTEADSYCTADVYLKDGAELPIPGARLVVIPAKVPEAVALLPLAGGTLVAGDALQNWGRTDEYFNWLARIAMRLMGFIKPYNLGPAWVKSVDPDKAALKGLLDLDFENLLPAHGDAVLGGAREKFRPAIEKATRGA